MTKREEARRGYETKAKKPWTDDPIIQQYRFCNVRRQDDKVTKWLAQNWYPHHEEPTFPAAMALARLFNNPQTLAEMGFPHFWNPSHVRAVAERRRDAGEKVFNAAYIVSTNGKAGSKIDYVIRMATDVLQLPLIKKVALANAYECLRTVEGLGGTGFLAAQIIADMKYVAPWNKAIDWWSWCSMGPGSKRGLNRLCGIDISSGWADSTFRNAVNEVRNRISEEGDMQLHAQDVQNCLCEFDKYMRAREGGRPKQLYPGR